MLKPVPALWQHLHITRCVCWQRMRRNQMCLGSRQGSAMTASTSADRHSTMQKEQETFERICLHTFQSLWSDLPAVPLCCSQQPAPEVPSSAELPGQQLHLTQLRVRLLPAQPNTQFSTLQAEQAVQQQNTHVTPGFGFVHQARTRCRTGAL